VEVTPEKKVVWVLQDWKNLGPATTAQFLDQPGVPEAPGICRGKHSFEFSSFQFRARELSEN